MGTNVSKAKDQSPSLFFKFLNGVERVGNALPHPIFLFAILCAIVILLSAVCEAMGVSVTAELVSNGELKEQTVSAVSLLNGAGVVHMLTKAVSNFTGFAALGTVLVAVLGVGVAEGSGYITAILKSTVANTPKPLVTPMLVFLGVMSNMASDAGYVILIPIGAMVFLACDRHPLAGLAATFAGVSGGFSANLLIGTTDPLLAGISTEAVKLVDPNYTVNATANMYFMMVSTFLITLVGTFVTDKIVEPRLGKFVAKKHVDEDAFAELSATEKKALKAANLSLLATVLLVVVVLLPENSFLRNAETGSIINKSPFMSSIVVLIAGAFFICGSVYGFVSGNYKSNKDLGVQLGKNMASMGSVLALLFVVAQFVSYFNYSNLGTILAVKGAELIEASNIGGIPLMIILVLFTAFINLFLGGASSKWSIMAPIFIPMFYRLGYTPELTQCAYRIGDSSTNIITPLMTYFAMIVSFANKYDEDAGIGSIISLMVPYSMFFLLGWGILLVIWMTFGLPLGPGAFLYL